MTSNICTLHPVRGVNRRDLICPRCTQSSGYVNLGVREYAGHCGGCKTYAIGMTQHDIVCPKCGSIDIQPERVMEGEVIPEICAMCADHLAKTEAVISAGGVLWRCDDCKRTGTLEAGHPLAQQVREQTDTQAPEPCAAILDRTTCPACGAGEGAENT